MLKRGINLKKRTCALSDSRWPLRITVVEILRDKKLILVRGELSRECYILSHSQISKSYEIDEQEPREIVPKNKYLLWAKATLLANNRILNPRSR
jgi:hypothetical protein